LSGEGAVSAAGLAALALLGLLVGSFLATLAIRLPRGLPVIAARSACPNCGRRLSALELIPLASWLAQGRRCRGCRRPISGFYPMMEISAAAVALLCGEWISWPLLPLALLGGWTALTLLGLWIFSMRAESTPGLIGHGGDSRLRRD
jgi:prepilin signal peptidase PulO-like enzyme (type II secretory pathway)